MHLDSELIKSSISTIDFNKSYAVIINDVVANGWLGNVTITKYGLDNYEKDILNIYNNNLYFSSDIRTSIEHILDMFDDPETKICFIPEHLFINVDNCIYLTIEELRSLYANQ